MQCCNSRAGLRTSTKLDWYFWSRGAIKRCTSPLSRTCTLAAHSARARRMRAHFEEEDANTCSLSPCRRSRICHGRLQACDPLVLPSRANHCREEDPPSRRHRMARTTLTTVSCPDDSASQCCRGSNLSTTYLDENELDHLDRQSWEGKEGWRIGVSGDETS